MCIGINDELYYIRQRNGNYILEKSIVNKMITSTLDDITLYDLKDCDFLFKESDLFLDLELCVKELNLLNEKEQAKQHSIKNVKLDIQLIPNHDETDDEPYFWAILNYDRNWYNAACGWSKTPEQAYKDGMECFKEMSKLLKI